MEKERGIIPKTVWLPDVFGNSYGMPQILAKSGIKYFVTHKPCVWNDTNQIPHHTFWWQGPDGSRVFAALSASHFVGTCEPDHIMLNWGRYTDKAKIGESMYCYGTWHTAMARPDLFAAIAPICGGGMAWNAHVLKMPAWVFHGAADETVSVNQSDEMVNAMRANGTDVKYTRMDGVGHGVWDYAYTDEMVKWLLSHQI